jgi:hypothetical protein
MRTAGSRQTAAGIKEDERQRASRPLSLLMTRGGVFLVVVAFICLSAVGAVAQKKPKPALKE